MILLEITIDRGFATLIAAVIAAVASVFVLLLNKKGEIRAANRKTLETFIYELSQAIHQLIATSNILLKNKSDVSRENWKEKAETAKTKLKELRPKIRYVLWGIDDSIQALTRLPDFTLYTLADEDVATRVVRRGTRLGDAIDRCIRDCYLNGRAPRFYEIWKIKLYEWHFRQTRDNYKANRKTSA